MSKPSIFICYSHEDKVWLSRLLPFVHSALKIIALTRKEIDYYLFIDRDIEGGEQWEERIREQIEQAEIVIVLLSVHTLSSDFIYRVEFPLLERLHRERGLRVVPILLGPCLYQEHPWLRHLQVLPRAGALSTLEKENIDVDVELHQISSLLFRIAVPGPGLRAPPERTDRASLGPASRSATEGQYLEIRQSGIERRPIVEPPPSPRATVSFNHTQPAPSWHGLPYRLYVQSIHWTAPQLGTRESKLVQQSGTPGFIKDEDEHQSSSKQLLTEP